MITQNYQLQHNKAKHHSNIIYVEENDDWYLNLNLGERKTRSSTFPESSS